MIERGKKGALEISFGWLFAIIAGVAIIALAIYFVTKFINVQQTTIGAETGKEIGVLLNPLETGFESAKTSMFSIPSETMIHNVCDKSGTFGNQELSLSQKSFGKWASTNVSVFFENKYIFSDADVEGKNFYIFSKPFEFPFKIADLIYLTSSLKDYCFVSPPLEIKNELNNLNQTNIHVNNCPENSIQVCFGSGFCDINVNYASKSIIKQGKSLHFETNALMYAGVFSEPGIYECQAARLMKRTEKLSNLYKDKSALISSKGCISGLDNDLIQLGDLAKTGNLNQARSIVDELNRNNEVSLCPLW